VLVSGFGGNSAGGSELVWRMGGVMVYASVPMLMLAGLLGGLSFLCTSARRHCQR
jgi:hypothetical protein